MEGSVKIDESESKDNLDPETCAIGDVTCHRGIVSVLTLKHIEGKGNRSMLELVGQDDLVDFATKEEVEDKLCRKDKVSGMQRKLSCWPCTIVMESVQALKCHLTGSKHQEALDRPRQDPKDFFLHNGKWKKRKGEKRRLGEEEGGKLSKRERTKINKQARDIPILAQHTAEKYNETETYIDGGLRKVKPYSFTFTTHAKGRWVGDSLYQIFAREFRALPPEEYKRCIQTGLIKINDMPTTPDCRVAANDVISHVVHRHELPVTSERIKIIHECADWVVVDKPSSIPVHPCGRYRHNTVLFILAKEENLPGLHTVHRLDRLTSGVLIFARSATKSREMEALISGREVKKEYVAKVLGEFPTGVIVCKEPIEVVSYKIGVCVVSVTGKDCHTEFERIDYKNGVSVVRCRPKTGRMHQIRVHLQFLGHPIVNDPLYNSSSFGPEKGMGGRLGKSKEQLILDLMESHTLANWIKSEEYLACKEEEEDVEEKENSDQLEVSDPDPVEEPIASSVEDEKGPNFDPNCEECKLQYKDPPPDTLVMFLHAFKYSGEGWQYQTDLPKWASLL